VHLTLTSTPNHGTLLGNVPMINCFPRHCVLALLVPALFLAPSLRADTPVRITIPGTAFSADVFQKVTVKDVGRARRFQGTTGFAQVTLRAKIPMPSAASNKPALERMIIRFRTSPQGPSVRAIEVKGVNNQFPFETNLAGDFTTREAGNVWTYKGGLRVFPQSFIQLKIQFPGGFDSAVKLGDILITEAVLEFSPAK
jgi:hypothetical protein